jgi:hypothetical protein
MKDLMCLIKFAKKKSHLVSLMNKGEIFFNEVQTYTDLNEPERGDSNEGAIWLKNAQFTNIRADHPTLGAFNFKPQKNTLGKITQYDFYYLVQSLYAITSDVFSKSDTFQISAKMKHFGDYALMIKKPYDFFNAIVSELKRQKIQYEVKAIEYKDLSEEGKYTVTPFIKDKEYSHQNEIRVIIMDKENKAKSIQIGSLADYCILTDTQTMIEMEWKAKRKCNN